MTASRASGAEVAPIEWRSRWDIVTVGLKVDPDDWKRPPADVIVSRVLAGVTATDPDTRGQIILLHDGGGDRSNTVEALPKLIDALRAKGFELVTVSDLAGLTRDQAMPPIIGRFAASLVDAPMFFALRSVGKGLTTLFEAAIWLGVARLLFLIILARSTGAGPPPQPPPPPRRHSSRC